MSVLSNFEKEASELIDRSRAIGQIVPLTDEANESVKVVQKVRRWRYTDRGDVSELALCSPQDVDLILATATRKETARGEELSVREAGLSAANNRLRQALTVSADDALPILADRYNAAADIFHQRYSYGLSGNTDELISLGVEKVGDYYACLEAVRDMESAVGSAFLVMDDVDIAAWEYVAMRCDWGDDFDSWLAFMSDSSRHPGFILSGFYYSVEAGMAEGFGWQGGERFAPPLQFYPFLVNYGKTLSMPRSIEELETRLADLSN